MIMAGKKLLAKAIARTQMEIMYPEDCYGDYMAQDTSENPNYERRQEIIENATHRLEVLMKLKASR